MDLLIEGLLEAKTLEDLQVEIIKLKNTLKVDHAVYHWVSADGEQYGCGTYDPAWAQRYQDKEYIRIDPVILGCFQRFHPVDWKRLDWSTRAARAFRKDALEYGIGSQGFSIPIRGPNGQFALFSISHNCSDDEWTEFTQENQRDLILIAHFFNQVALEMEKDRAPEPLRALSPRETDALTFLAMGYGRGQVSDMLDISEHTLRAYIESARFKLGAQNTVHAITKAMIDGRIVVGGTSRGASGNWPGRQSESAANSTHGNQNVDIAKPVA